MEKGSGKGRCVGSSGSLLVWLMWKLRGVVSEMILWMVRIMGDGCGYGAEL